MALVAVTMVVAASCGDSRPSEVRDVPVVVTSPPVELADPELLYDPVRFGEERPDGFAQLLGRDDIAPVYRPEFVEGAGVGWPDDALVVGVEIDGDARAYPVGFLNRREMVNDWHRGIPTLVTW